MFNPHAEPRGAVLPSKIVRLRPRLPAAIEIRSASRSSAARMISCSRGIRARILYMTTLSVADARANFSKLVEAAATTHERFEVTRNGDRAVVVLGVDDYDALLETLDILSNADEVQAIQEGIRAIENGETHSAEEVRQAMLQRPAG